MAGEREIIVVSRQTPSDYSTTTKIVHRKYESPSGRHTCFNGRNEASIPTQLLEQYPKGLSVC